MRITGILFLLVSVLLQGCSEVMAGVRLAIPIIMFIVIVGALFYAIYGNRNASRTENDRRKPDADDRK